MLFYQVIISKNFGSRFALAWFNCNGISNVISGTGVARVAQGAHAPPPNVDRRVKKKKGKKRKNGKRKGKMFP